MKKSRSVIGALFLTLLPTSANAWTKLQNGDISTQLTNPLGSSFELRLSCTDQGQVRAKMSGSGSFKMTIGGISRDYGSSPVGADDPGLRGLATESRARFNLGSTVIWHSEWGGQVEDWLNACGARATTSRSGSSGSTIASGFPSLRNNSSGARDELSASQVANNALSNALARTPAPSAFSIEQLGNRRKRETELNVTRQSRWTLSDDGRIMLGTPSAPDGEAELYCTSNEVTLVVRFRGGGTANARAGAPYAFNVAFDAGQPVQITRHARYYDTRTGYEAVTTLNPRDPLLTALLQNRIIFVSHQQSRINLSANIGDRVMQDQMVRCMPQARR